MKPMADRKMDMSRGSDVDTFFPEAAQSKRLPRAGEIKGFKYPDTEESVLRDQNQFVKETSGNMPKPEFRH